MAKATYPPYAEAVILARQQAHRIIVRKIKASGRIKLSTLTAATLARLAIELVEARPDLITAQLEALSSPPLAPAQPKPGK
jgi:soluble lytic murein transglycosylase-like protein